ncbi:MAG: glycosyltransferase family 4 protein [Elusimicrobia bacterium]|nr:glycosyltransferase family 4 protein [Elusimicrobiota bacterium]
MAHDSRKIKVVHVITRLDLGGAQQNTLHTVRHLDASRFEVLLVCGRGGPLEGEVAAMPPEAHWRALFMSSLVRHIHPGLDLLAFLQLVSLFHSERPDVVHTHSSKAGVLGRLAAAAAGVPCVVHTYHGFGFNDYQSPWIKAFYVWAERLCCALSDALIFVSNANRDYARRHRLGRPDRYRLIRSGIKLSDFPASVENPGQKKASLGLGMHKPLVLSVGNLKPQKNPGDFVALAEKVAAAGRDCSFLYIGDGPLRRRLEYLLIATGLGNRFALPGWRRDIPELMAVADVFVLTSLWEGLPRALVEAMKSGLPCVCYATDGVLDLLEDGVNGFVVPQGNVTLLGERVARLLADEDLRRRIGRKAAESIGEEFDIDAMVRRQERLYDELLPAP